MAEWNDMDAFSAVGMGNPVAPQPVVPQPVAPTVAPQTAASAVVAPQAVAPQGFAPQPAVPQPVAPTVAPQTAAPAVVAPQAVAPQGFAPQPVVPQPVAPTVAPQTAAPAVVAPQAVAPQGFAPQPVVPQPVAPTVAPQTVAPAVVAPQAVAPQGFAPQPAVPQPVAPTVVPQAAVAAVVAPQAVAPQGFAPQPVVPQPVAPTVVPQTAAPAVVAPQAVAPQFVAPQPVVYVEVPPQPALMVETPTVVAPQAVVSEAVPLTAPVAKEEVTPLGEAPTGGGMGGNVPPADDGKAPDNKDGKKDKGKKNKRAKPKTKSYWRRRIRKRRTRRAFKRVLVITLSLLLGIVIGLGSVFGALYFAVGGMTVDFLQKLGIVGATDAYLKENSEVNLTSISILELIADLQSIGADLGSYSLGGLIDRYGIILSEDVMRVLPAGLMSLPLDELASENAGEAVANSITFGYIFGLLPEEMFEPRVAAVLSPRPLSLLTEGKYGELLRGIQLGYLTGVQYDAEGNVVYANPDAPTVQEMAAVLDLGEIFATVTENGDILGMIAGKMGELPIAPFLSGVTEGALVEIASGDKKIKDIICLNEETGRYEFSLPSLTDGVLAGSFMGYTFTDGVWKNADGSEVKGLSLALAALPLTDVVNGQLDVVALMDGFYLGDLQAGYERGEALPAEKGEGFEWFKNGSAVTTIERVVANVSLSGVLGGTLDWSRQLGDLAIGEVQGYRKEPVSTGGVVTGHRWLKENEETHAWEPVGTVLSTIADVKVAGVVDGSTDMVEVLGALCVGDAEDYVRNSENWWCVREETTDGIVLTPVNALENAIANIPLYKLLQNEFDLAESLDGVCLGDAEGYQKIDGKWYREKTDAEGNVLADPEGMPLLEYVGDMENALANVSVSDVVDGKLSAENIFEGLYLGDIQGYEKKTDGWYAAVTDAEGNVQYETDGVTPMLAPVGVVQGAISDVKISDIMSGGFKLTDAVAELCVGDAAGYEKRADGWYTILTDDDGNVQYETDGITPKAEKVGKIESAVADIKLSDVLNGSMRFSDVVGSLYVGDCEGYVKGEDGKWYENGVFVGAVENAVANISLSKMFGEELKLSDTLGALYLGDAQGYEKKADGWHTTVKDEHGNVQYEADGVTPKTVFVGAVENAIADVKISAVMAGEFDLSQALSSLLLGDAMGYVRVGEADADGKYDFGRPAENEGDPVALVTGTVREVANLSLSALLEGNADLEGTVRSMTLAEALELKQSGGKWYEKGVDGEADTAKPVEGILAVLADYPINEITADTVNGILLADVFGYAFVDTDNDGEPDTFFTHYDEEDEAASVKASGVMSKLAALTVGELSDSEALEATVRSMTLAEALDYTLVGDTWYSAYTDNEDDTDDVPVTGILSVLADKKINEMNSEIINAVYMGDVLGYIHKDTDGVSGPDTWYVDENTPAEGMMAKIADFTVGELSDGVVLEEKMKTLSLADVLGYKKVGDVWYDGDVPARGVLIYMAELSVGDLSDSSKVSAQIDKAKLYEVLGYRFEDTDSDDVADAWVKEGTGEKATGAIVYLMESTVGELSDGNAVNAKLENAKLYELLGYVLDTESGKWTKDGVAATGAIIYLMEATVGELSNAETLNARLDDAKLYEVLGYTYDKDTDKWQKTVKEGEETRVLEATGVMRYLMDKRVGNLQASMDDMLLWNALGYTEKDGVYYTVYTDNDNPLDDVRVTGVLSVLAGKKISELNDATINDIQLGVALGYEKRADGWYHDGVPASGLLVHLADLSIGQLSDNDAVSGKLDEATIAEALGYTYDSAEKQWKKGDIVAAGPMLYLMDKKLGSLQASIDNMPLGFALGYIQIEGEWYEIYSDDGDDTNDVKASGVAGALADELMKNAENALKTMVVGEACGYIGVDTDENGKPDTWYVTYTDDGDDSNDVRVNGIVSAFVNLTVEELSDNTKLTANFSELRFGEARGYIYNEADGFWYTRYDSDGTFNYQYRVRGLMSALADKPMKHIDEDLLQKELKIGTMMGYSYTDPNPNDADDTERAWCKMLIITGEVDSRVEGIEAIIADCTLAGVGDRLNNLTISDLYPLEEGEQRTGILSLLDDDAKIVNLETEFEAAVGTATVQQMLNTGLIAVSEEQQAVMDDLLPTWREMSFASLFTELLREYTGVN